MYQYEIVFYRFQVLQIIKRNRDQNLPYYQGPNIGVRTWAA